MTNQSSLRAQLVEQLQLARERDKKARLANTTGAGIEVPPTGAAVSNAYEQLRNAAEYAEEHLLLQHAIKRFLKLNLFLTKQPVEEIGRELIVELVQAGYLKNEGLGTDAIENVNALIRVYMQTYGRLRQAKVGRDRATDWMLAFMSVGIENLLNPHSTHQALIFTAYRHFLDIIVKDQYVDLPEGESYELCLYIAVHQALLKSDVDVVRHELFYLYQLRPESTEDVRNFNEQIDRLYSCELTGRLRRVVSRYGAPFRVLKSMIDDRDDVATLLNDKEVFLDAFRKQTAIEYRQVERRLNRGLIKSIIFIIITKLLIGAGIEIPYDIWIHGAIAWIPLAVNLLFPPLYMAMLKLGLRAPSAANAQTLQHYIGKMLFEEGEIRIFTPLPGRMGIGRRLVYIILFLVPVAITILALQGVGFNVVQMFIFFMFFSTASSLGFRLSSLVREVEINTRQPGLLTSLRDFFYLPFIMFGQWLSRKYSKLNLVARFLDVAIELPLKAILRLIRQWIRFLNEKRDELY